MPAEGPCLPIAKQPSAQIMMNLQNHHYHYEAGSNPAAPPLLLLHGTGGTETDLLPLARVLSPGSTVLSPRGRVSEHGANRFFARLAEGVFDLDEVTRRTQELADFIEAVTQAHGIAPGRLLALGFSNGANVAATMLQLRPDILNGGILLRPMVVLDHAAAANSLQAKRILIANGMHDPIVPEDHPERLADLLRAGGADVKVSLAKAGHNLTATDITAAKTFLHPRVGGGA
jgi:phospholipase/carboxylesterase